MKINYKMKFFKVGFQRFCQHFPLAEVYLLYNTKMHICEYEYKS